MTTPSVDIVFFIMAALLVLSSLGVVLLANPLYSALSLAVSMITMAALFFRLDAQFLAAVQLIVYAGAVMVLFVMVLMLFDVRHDLKVFSRGLISGGLKIVSTGIICGLISGAIMLASRQLSNPSRPVETSWIPDDITKDLAALLFTKYVFGFEAMGILLLVIAIGAVALSRVKGGTHANHE